VSMWYLIRSMMKKSVFLLLMLSCFAQSNFAAKIFPDQPKDLFIVDNFEDKNFTMQPKWWGFDNISMEIARNDKKEFQHLEEYSLKLEGTPNNWYVGGVGTYFAIDVANYNSLKLLVRGNGPLSGLLIIELFDDDNNNFQVEVNPSISSETLADDKFIRTIKVDWSGWKALIIPFSDFVDGNINVGDDKWNPYQTGSSGGLLQMQMILLAADKEIKPKIAVDSIKIYQQGPMKLKESAKSNTEEDSEDFF
jgi:hypothetical protein